MAPRNSPTVWRRLLAAELKELREERRLNQKEVAAECGWSGARLSYLENGGQIPNEDDLDQLLPLYGVAGDEGARFYEAVKFAREKGWWERADDQVIPPHLRRFVGLEQGASLIRVVEPYVVPGLLQSRSYIEANLRGDLVPRTERQIARIADVRIRRQEILFVDDPVEFDAVIDESVLRRVVGGFDVMAAQLDAMVEMAGRPNVSLRVLPFQAGVKPAMMGGFRIVSFPRTTSSVLYLEHRSGAEYYEDTGNVEQHVLYFDQVVDAALSLEDSGSLIEEFARSYGERASDQR